MNSVPMALRLVSGSATPASRSRKRSAALTWTRLTWKSRRKVSSTCSASPWRRSRHRVAVAHPHRLLGWEVAEEHAVAAGAERGAAVLAHAGRLHPTAEDPGHGLLPVAEPQHGQAELEQAGVEGGRAGLVHRSGAAREDQRPGAAGAHLGRVEVARDDLGVDVALAHPARDELGVLCPEVEDEDGVVPGRRRAHAAEHSSRSSRARDPVKCPDRLPAPSPREYG